MGLLMFYGTECVHCHEMMPLIKKLENETGVKVKQVETWHNSANKSKLEQADKGGKCGGVPFFLNEETGNTICGSTDYDKLKKWAGK